MKYIYLYLLIATFSYNSLEATRTIIPCVFVYDQLEHEECLVINGHVYDIKILKHSDECGCEELPRE